jgi:hypothetical protein
VVPQVFLMPSSAGGSLLRAKPDYPAAVSDFLSGAYTSSEFAGVPEHAHSPSSISDASF